MTLYLITKCIADSASIVNLLFPTVMLIFLVATADDADCSDAVIVFSLHCRQNRCDVRERRVICAL